MMRDLRLAWGFLLCMGALALVAPYLAPYDPFAMDLEALRASPSLVHPLGTDDKGRDLLSRLLWGARLSLGIGLICALAATGLGMGVGLLTGYWGGWVDRLGQALIDVVLAFPSLLLAIALAVVLPPGPVTVMGVLILVGWAPLARIFRGMVQDLATRDFVEAARACGCGPGRILLRHLLPHCLPLAMVLGTSQMGHFILAEAALSFLGLGAQPPTPSWGAMISLHRLEILGAPWMVLFPGLALTVSVVVTHWVGDRLRDRLLEPGRRLS